LVGVALLASTAGASELRFSTTTAGNVAATGNALGLSKQATLNGPGTSDSIGTFTSLEATAVDDSPLNAANPWFAGTTNDWTQNGADAALVLPDNAEVLYAELIWGGSTAYGSEDVTGELESNVTLSFGGDALDVAPDPITALTIAETSQEDFAANYYMRSADVTDFVAEHGAGVYSASGIPATQDSFVDSLNAAGWTLVVAYRNSGEPIRNLSVFVGGSFVDEEDTEDYAVSGFCTPPQGAFGGNVIVSAMEGDASRTGDSLAIAEDEFEEFIPIVGLNNPLNNFFCSQINDGDGLLDTSGTFGDRNHNPAGTNADGGRQGWDITRVPVSSDDDHLINGQTSATIRTQTLDDSYVPTLVAFGIQVNAPDFTGAGAQAAPGALALEEVATVTIDMENVGLVDAMGLSFTAGLPTGLALDGFALDGVDGDINGNPVDEGALAAGVSIGDVATGVAKQIVLEVRAVGEPTGGTYVISPGWTYDYVSCTGEDPLSEPHALPDVVIDFIPDEVGSTGGDSSGEGGQEETGASASDSNSASASITVTASDSASDTDSVSDSDSLSGGVSMPSDGCGCRSQGSGSASWLLLGLLGLLRRRRA
jgi:MYXO-CTERM domain-containing protein